MRALSLVNGRPYEDIRKRGGIWLSEQREDQNLLVAIVDTAHLAATIRRGHACAYLPDPRVPNDWET